MLTKDLQNFIISGGKEARLYIHHFIHDLRGCHAYQCMFCFQYFSSVSSRNNHLAKIHRNDKAKVRTLASMVPRSKKRRYLCLICGYEGRTPAEVLQHVSSDHDFHDCKRFALVQASNIQDLVARNHAPHRHCMVTIKDRDRHEVSIVTVNDWKELYDQQREVSPKLV